MLEKPVSDSRSHSFRKLRLKTYVHCIVCSLNVQLRISRHTSARSLSARRFTSSQISSISICTVGDPVKSTLGLVGLTEGEVDGEPDSTGLPDGDAVTNWHSPQAPS